MNRTRIFKFDSEGNLISVRHSREPEVRITRKGGAFKYSVSQGGKIIHAGILGNLESCAYCHKKIAGKIKKLGILNFHYECYFLFDSWQRKNEC